MKNNLLNKILRFLVDSVSSLLLLSCLQLKVFFFGSFILTKMYYYMNYIFAGYIQKCSEVFIILLIYSIQYSVIFLFLQIIQIEIDFIFYLPDVNNILQYDLARIEHSNNLKLKHERIERLITTLIYLFVVFF